MNVVVLSPAFPPTTERFCAALQARGVRVLGVGDWAPEALPPALRATLAEYVHLPNMGDYDVLRAAVAGLAARHGPIHRLDSVAEHWMGHEGRLRDDLGVAGLGAAQTARQRSKTGMAELFGAAGVASPAGMRVERGADLMRAAEALGLPLVLKPDAGSGAAATFAVRDDASLARAAAGPLGGYLAQPFVEGDIVTFDGLANTDGQVVFCTSHEYDTGIMEVLTGRLDGHYYSLREIPPELEAIGRRAVAAFDVRERFFHAEFFRKRDGSYVALEMNLRPPGGFTTDLMNLACEFDVYDLWAGVVTGERWQGFAYARKYHTAHAGRRRDRAYHVSHDDLVHALGDTLAACRPVPREFAPTMGDDAYLLRHADLDALRAAIALVQQPARTPRSTSEAPKRIEYSPEQQRIIAHRGAHLQVVACAGSGKTETVAVRVVTLLEDEVAPEGIVAFTFTRAAAAGLKTRILTRYQERNPGANLDRLSPLYVGTIHAYCLRLLQVHVPRYATFDLYDEHRLIGLVLREYFELGLQDLGLKNLTDCARDFVRNVAVVENEMIPVDELPEGAFKRVYLKLLDALDRYHVLTYNQCIARAVAALDDASAFARVHAPLRHLIVDEFQDINPAQARLIERLAAAPVQLCVVGDDDQAIYQWRGSSVAYLQAFQSKFGAAQHVLGLNRRSSATLVDAAAAFAGSITPRVDKPIVGARAARVDALRCYGAATAAEEAEAVADAIKTLHDAGVAFRDMAVLLRAVKTSGEAFLDAFDAKGILYRCEGRSELFLQADARFFAYLYAWLAGRDSFYNARKRAVDEVTLGSLLTTIDALYAPDAAHRKQLADALPVQRKAGPQSVDADLVGSFYRLASLLQIDRWDANDKEKAARLGSLARFTAVLADFESVTRRARRINDPVRGETVRGGLHGGEKYLKKFADYLSFYAQSDYEDFAGEPDFDLDAVTVSTVHAAKGLEWPVVFVPCLSAQRFPSSKSGTAQDWMIPRSLFPAARYEGTDADERRLFYVAMTRARDLLVLSTHERVTTRAAKPSPFFTEVSQKKAIAFPPAFPLPAVMPEPPTLDDDKPTYSFSELAQYGTCPLQYRLRNRLSFQPRAVKELGYGHAVHHVLRRIAEHTQATGQVPGFPEVHALFHREFYLPLADRPAWDSMQARARTLVAHYLSHHAEDLARVWEVERPFELHLEHANVTGRADVILDREGGIDGALAIVDYKTHRVDVEPEMGLQLQVYTAAGRGEGHDVRAAWLHDLTAKGNTARLPVETRPAAIEGAREKVDAWAKGIREGRFAACPGDHCKRCDVRELCAHRKA